MAENARGEVPAEMDGLSAEEAVDRILERDDSLERDAVRKRIKYVTSDGVVCREGIDDGLTEAAEIVSSPENRIDLGRREFETAVERAEPVADLLVVASRLEEFEERLLALKEEVDRLGPELNELFNEWLEEPDDVYAMADGLHQHATRGRRMHRLVDELIVDLESFQEWLGDEDVRIQELEEDVESVDESLADLEAALADFEGPGANGRGTDEGDGGDTTGAEATGDEAGDAAGDGGDPEPVFVWVDALLRHRLVGLLIDDLETELGGLRTWADREGSGSDDQWDRLAEQTAGVRDRWSELEGRIDAAARPDWRDRFGERLAAFESDLDVFDPPVDWGEVQLTLEEHRAEIVPDN
jgi:archaellum component FlaC